MQELMTMGKGTQMKPIEQLLTTWYVDVPSIPTGNV